MFEDIKIEVAAMRESSDANEHPTGNSSLTQSSRSSTARKNSVQEHYKQFYGGGEDDVITSIS